MGKGRHILEGKHMDVFEVSAHTKWWNEITEEVQVPESVTCKNDFEHST